MQAGGLYVLGRVKEAGEGGKDVAERVGRAQQGQAGRKCKGKFFLCRAGKMHTQVHARIDASPRKNIHAYAKYTRARKLSAPLSLSHIRIYAYTFD